MSYLAQAKKPETQPPVLTIVGFPGVGKTSLAALFPSPIFVQAENANRGFEDWPEELQPMMLQQLPAPNFKRDVRPSEVLIAQLRELATEEHHYQTVVIDTVTTLHTLLESEVVEFYRPTGAEKPVSNIGEAEGGYGKGLLAVAAIHSRIRTACEYLRMRGMGVIFLAHTGLEKVTNRPDTPEYATWSLEMHKASKKIYVATSDLVIYLRSREYVTGGETDKKGRTTKLGKIRSTGERYAITSADGTIGMVDAKNPYQMPVEIEIPLGENPLMQYIPYYNRGNENV